MRFSIIALTVAVVSSAPSLALNLFESDQPALHSSVVLPKIVLSREALTRRATEEILKRFDIAKYIHDHPQVVRPLSPINAIARDEATVYSARFFDPNPVPHRTIPGTRILNAIEARDEDIAKRIIASEITPALGRWISQHPGVAIAREDDHELEARRSKGAHGHKKGHKGHKSRKGSKTGHKGHKSHKKGSKKSALKPAPTKAPQA